MGLPLCVAQHSALSTQHSALSTQHSALSMRPAHFTREKGGGLGSPPRGDTDVMDGNGRPGSGRQLTANYPFTAGLGFAVLGAGVATACGAAGLAMAAGEAVGRVPRAWITLATSAAVITPSLSTSRRANRAPMPRVYSALLTLPSLSVSYLASPTPSLRPGEAAGLVLLAAAGRTRAAIAVLAAFSSSWLRMPSLLVSSLVKRRMAWSTYWHLLTFPSLSVSSAANTVCRNGPRPVRGARGRAIGFAAAEEVTVTVAA